LDFDQRVDEGDEHIFVDDRKVWMPSWRCKADNDSKFQEVTVRNHRVRDGCLKISGKWPIFYIYIQRTAYRRREPECPCEPLRVQAPTFASTARGTPKEWNRPDNEPADSDESQLFWGSKKCKEHFGRDPRFSSSSSSRPDEAAEPDVAGMLHSFLKTRPGKQGGYNLCRKFGPPVRQEDGWFRFEWTKKSRVPSEGKWQRAWHGCKMEALYSIIYWEGLFESCKDQYDGDRNFAGLPGVYVHKDKTGYKVGNYVRFVPFEGVFWAAKWEVLVDRNKALDLQKSTDQWVHHQSDVHLQALWLCGRTPDAMQLQDPVARAWDPELEAHPNRFEKKRTKTTRASPS